MDDTLSARRAGGLRPPLRAGPDLSRRLHRQLVPALPDRRLRSRSRPRGAALASSTRFAIPLADGTGSITIATTRPETMLGDIAVAVNPTDERYTHLHRQECCACRSTGPRDSHRRRRLGQARVRHRSRQGHARARPQRLRHRPAPQPAFASASSTRPRTSTVPGSPYHGLDRYRGPQAHRRRPRSARPARRRQGPHQLHRQLRPLQRRRHRAAPLHAVVPVKIQPLADKAIAAVEQGPHPVHARPVQQDLHRVDEQHPRLVHLAPALVGPSHPRLALRAPASEITVARETPTACAHCGSDRPHAGDRRARHLVLLRPAALHRLRLARRRRSRPRRLLPHAAAASPASTFSSSGSRA